MTDEPDVVVFRHDVHGMDPADYAAAIRDRLPGYEVALARTPGEERDLVGRAPVATGVYFDESLLDHADGLCLFACGYAGTGHLPMDALAERDVAVTNASGVHGPNIAEYVVGATLSFVRRFEVGWRRQGRREWRHFRGRELMGSTVTVVGLGAIGSAIVERLRGFGVDTVGVRYSPEKGGPTDEVLGYDDPDALHEAFARTDVLVLACPLTETTRGLVDRAVLETLPADALVVNVARGPVVVTDDLVAALRSNRIGGAALDVTDPEPLPAEHPLWRLGNVQITPHNSGHTPRYWDRLADILAENLRRVEETGRYEDLQNQVV